jgi:hypothetical protein
MGAMGRRRRRHEEELERSRVVPIPEHSSSLQSRPFEQPQESETSQVNKSTISYNLGQLAIYAKADSTQPNHEEKLVTTAQAFDRDELAQTQLPDLKFLDSAKREEDSTVSEDLLSRVDRYHKFLQLQGLSRNPMPPMFGVRDPRIAHELATRWTLNPKSGELASFSKKQELAKQLVEMSGRDATASVEWANTRQVQRLRELLRQIDSSSENAGTKEANSDPKRELEQLIEAIMKAHGTQQTPAAEGYPKGDRRRLPNLRDTETALHVGGEAIDLFLDWSINPTDPMVDAIAAQFGLQRPIRDAGEATEPWHYERSETRLDNRIPGEEAHLEK